MKKVIAVVFCMILACTTLVQAQDEMVVAGFTGQLDYVSLTDVIQGDTLTDGTRANVNRVYKLEKGSFHLLNGRIEANDFDLKIIGEPGDDTTPPATVFHDVNAEGGHDDDMIRCAQNVILKNILFNASDINSSPSKRFLDVASNDSRIEIDNCIFENFTNRLIDLRGIINTSIFFTNNLAMNIVDTNNEWGANIFHTASTDGDTIWVQNNTFYNFGHNATAPGMKFDFSWWNHNTFVNFGHRILGHEYCDEHYFTENIILNASIVGEDSTWFPENGGSWEAVFGLVDSDTLVDGPVASRKVWYDANVVEESPAFDALYDNYSKNTQRWYIPIKGERLEWMIADNEAWPSVADGDWYKVEPNFVDNSKVLVNLDQQVAWAQEQWSGTDTLRTDRIWDMDGDADPLTTPWPIPLNLAYDDEALLVAGHNDLPLGDLRWFPEAKTQWEAEKENIAETIKTLVKASAYVAGVEDNVESVRSFDLAQNYPNPFNPTTTIEFSLNQSAKVNLTVYNTTGQIVKTLISQKMNAGTHSIIWDGTNALNRKVVSGLYLYKLESDDFTQTKKMMLVK